MKRRLYVDPESGSLADCSASPHRWDSAFCVVLRDNEALWQRYLDAERAFTEARQAVLDVTTEEPVTAEEQGLYGRLRDLHSMGGLDSSEWKCRYNEIKAQAQRLAESDGQQLDVSMFPVSAEEKL